MERASALVNTAEDPVPPTGEEDIGRPIAAFVNTKTHHSNNLGYGSVVSFHPASKDGFSAAEWGVEYRTGVCERVQAVALMEALRLGVVLSKLEAEGRAHVCERCGAGLQTISGLRYFSSILHRLISDSRIICFCRGAGTTSIAKLAKNGAARSKTIN